MGWPCAIQRTFETADKHFLLYLVLIRSQDSAISSGTPLSVIVAPRCRLIIEMNALKSSPGIVRLTLYKVRKVFSFSSVSSRHSKTIDLDPPAQIGRSCKLEGVNAFENVGRHVQSNTVQAASLPARGLVEMPVFNIAIFFH